MRLFIRLQDGQPVDHPIYEENMRQAYPGIDLDNLPETFAEFERIDVPALQKYEIYEGVTYQWVDGIVKDVHSVRPMTDEEKAELEELL
jgi:hypothetical protein